MEDLLQFFSNQFLITAVTAWFVAQSLKTVIHMFVYGKFDIRRLFGDGGMPSAHSATVTSVAAFSAYVFGFGSFQFAIAVILATIVCHDAMGVRLETEKQTAVITELVNSSDNTANETLSNINLKAFVGHSGRQVFAGATVGILVATLMHFLVF